MKFTKIYKCSKCGCSYLFKFKDLNTCLFCSNHKIDASDLKLHASEQKLKTQTFGSNYIKRKKKKCK